MDKIIKAEPGWYLISPGAGEDGNLDYVVKLQILAWCIQCTRHTTVFDAKKPIKFTEAIPITIDKFEYEHRNGTAILSPNGIYTIPNEISFDSVEDLISYWEETLKSLDPEDTHPNLVN